MVMNVWNELSVEIAAPDIEVHKTGNTGIDYVHSRDSGRPGPHVMLSALVHGNELCGAVVLDELLRRDVRPLRGRLTLGFMNPAAYRQFDPRAPLASRYVDEDFNRVWSSEALANGDSVERRRARILRPLIDTVDRLLDLHSMQLPSPPLLLTGARDKGVELARRVAYPAFIVRDEGHAAGVRLRDYAAFNDPRSERNALLVECGQHWQAVSIDVARRTTYRFLASCGMLDAAAQPPATVAQRVIEVTDVITAATPRFRFADNYRGMECIERAATLIAEDDDRMIRTPYDRCWLIMPTHKVLPGQTAVRLGREQA